MRPYNVQSFQNEFGQVAASRQITPDGAEQMKLDTFLDSDWVYDHVTIRNASIPKYALAFRTGALMLSAPNLTQLPEGSFESNSGITEVSAPLAASIGSRCFWAASKLECAVFPAAANVGQHAFRYASALKAADFGGTPASGQGFTSTGAFTNCTQLKTLILRGGAVWNLSYTSTFDGTPFSSSGSGGTLYVPSALIQTYQAASNWSTLLGYANNQIEAIEGSVYETQHADGTPISA